MNLGAFSSVESSLSIARFFRFGAIYTIISSHLTQYLDFVILTGLTSGNLDLDPRPS